MTDEQGVVPVRPEGRAGRGVRAEAVIDLAAISANTALLCRAAEPAALMAVVKADGYGHGAAAVAGAALRGGAVALGVATIGEAIALRAAGVDAPLAAWLWSPFEDIRPAVAAGVQIGVSSVAHLDAVARAAGPVRPAEVHLKVDTGLGRNGAGPAEQAGLLTAAAAAQASGRVTVVGIMSHLANAEVAGDPSVGAQTAQFAAACDAAAAAGLRPRWRHLANTAATLQWPRTRFDLVRCGIGLYGLSPVDDQHGLHPAMSLRAAVALTKRVPVGHGVSYGLSYRTVRETTLALVPLGYADGIPRVAGSVAEVLLGGKRRRIAGRVAMDQFVLDCGDDAVTAGDEVLVLGAGGAGEPTAKDWAAWCGTIDYEIVARLGDRVPRRYRGRR